MPIPRKERKALAQVRCGVAPLILETGRWEKCNNIQVPGEENECLHCLKIGFIETENDFNGKTFALSAPRPQSNF